MITAKRAMKIMTAMRAAYTDVLNLELLSAWLENDGFSAEEIEWAADNVWAEAVSDTITFVITIVGPDGETDVVETHTPIQWLLDDGYYNVTSDIWRKDQWVAVITMKPNPTVLKTLDEVEEGLDLTC